MLTYIKGIRLNLFEQIKISYETINLLVTP